MPGVGELFVMLLIPIFFAGLGFWIWAIVDCATKEPAGAPGDPRVMWLLIVVLAGWIGALIYVLVRRPQRKAMFGQ